MDCEDRYVDSGAAASAPNPSLSTNASFAKTVVLVSALRIPRKSSVVRPVSASSQCHAARVSAWQERSDRVMALPTFKFSQHSRSMSPLPTCYLQSLYA